VSDPRRGPALAAPGHGNSINGCFVPAAILLKLVGREARPREGAIRAIILAAGNGQPVAGRPIGMGTAPVPASPAKTFHTLRTNAIIRPV
jgi:hypothetical protein